MTNSFLHELHILINPGLNPGGFNTSANVTSCSVLEEGVDAIVYHGKLFKNKGSPCSLTTN
jgi:hypothetical protein